MPRQCGCLGGNQNCTFCYGSGYVTGSDFAPASEARKSWSAGPVLPKTSRKVSRHTATIKRTKASKNVATPRTNRPLVKCTKCPNPVLVREDRLARHLQKCHGVPGMLPVISHTATPIPAQTMKGLQPRPILSNIKRPTQSRSGEAETVRGYMPSDDVEQPSEIDNHRIERRLDGSRDYWQIREEGRFGSHPSFDSCDDESAP